MSRYHRHGDIQSGVLSQLESGSGQLVRSCTLLQESIPTVSNDPTQDRGAPGKNTDWPVLLGSFKNISNLLNDLGQVAEEQLEHTVPVPKAPGVDKEGRPTMVIPNLLTTKLSPEIEKSEQELRKSLKKFLPASDLNDEERETICVQRIQDLKNSVRKLNKDLDETVEDFVTSESFALLKQKAGATLTKFSAPNSTRKSQEGVDLLQYMLYGQCKDLKTQKVREGALKDLYGKRENEAL